MGQPSPTPTLVGPPLLRGLDDVHPTNDGWVADCPICTNPARGTHELLEVTRGPLRYELSCDGGCTHDDLADYLQADTRLDHQQLAAVWRATVLAPRIDTCEALLAGEPVPRSAIDPVWARRFRL